MQKTTTMIIGQGSIKHYIKTQDKTEEEEIEEERIAKTGRLHNKSVL